MTKKKTKKGLGITTNKSLKKKSVKQEPIKVGDRVLVNVDGVNIGNERIGTVLHKHENVFDVKLDDGMWEAGRERYELELVKEEPKVYLLMDYNESNGDDEFVIGVFASSSLAEEARKIFIDVEEYNKPTIQDDVYVRAFSLLHEMPDYLKPSPKSTCDGKVVEIDGKKYELKEV